jgi:endonuclease/exonuclease/phosphatase family metal-dependent hydrolase
MAEEQELKIMSYNIWNYNEPWRERRKIIVEGILEADPDIVGLQEIRDDRRYNPIGCDQARQIADRTGMGYRYQPAMTYSNSPRSVEGLCVMSRYPIASTAYVTLTREPDDDKDSHQRIVLNGTVSLPVGDLEFFVTHFSLSPEMGVSNSLELLEFVSSFDSSLPKFIVGDFNSTPADRPVKILTGSERVTGQPAIGNLLDTWVESRPDGRKGGPNGPCSHGSRRIDFIFMVPSPWTQASVEEVAYVNPKDQNGLAGSDHRAVRTTVSLSRHA